MSEFFCRYQARNVIKKDTPSLVFSCHFCEIIKDIFFIEHLRWLLLPILKLLDSQLAFLCLFLARTSFLFTSRRSCVWENMTFLIFHLTKQLKCHVTFYVGPPSSCVRTLPSFGGHGPCECGDKTFLICHLTTISKSHVTLWVGYSHLKSPTG